MVQVKNDGVFSMLHRPALVLEFDPLPSSQPESAAKKQNKTNKNSPTLVKHLQGLNGCVFTTPLALLMTHS